MLLASDTMTTRTTFTMDESLAEQARRLGINVSAAARDGVAAAIRAAQLEHDRAAYLARPERADEFWTDADAWSNE